MRVVLFFFPCLAGSNCSSSSEGESTPTALHAGICVRQQSVSLKDAIIAREALSLLVTCLQLRSQQLSKKRAHPVCTTLNFLKILPVSIESKNLLYQY